jgi:hypothetical protein
MIDLAGPWHPPDMAFSPRSPRTLLPLLLGLALPALSGCSDDGSQEDAGDEVGDGDGDANGDGDGDPSGDGDEGTSGADEGGDGDPSGDGGGDGDGDTGGNGQPGQLTAGEWRDLDHWDFWLGLGAANSSWANEFDLWGLDTRERIPVLALIDNVPVADVPVVLRDANQQILWRARTDNQGRAELWPTLFGSDPAWPLTIVSGAQSLELDELPDGFDPLLLELPAQNPVADLDLMFVVDTTGSMSDELNYLKVELGDVIQRVQSEVNDDFSLRISVNFYRDHGDDYVVRSFPFTTDVPTALGQLADQSAGGGGDWPEAVDEALADAIDGHSWSTDARARLCFLVLDAPPHDQANVRARLNDAVVSAAAKGIRVIPVAASGVDKETEFLLRNIDIATGATYTFLTDHSGIGNPHLEPTVGEYEVELLNDLLVRLIVEAMK